jgi:hypothetical protein
MPRWLDVVPPERLMALQSDMLPEEALKRMNIHSMDSGDD